MLRLSGFWRIALLLLVTLVTLCHARQQCRLVSKLDVQPGDSNPQLPLSGSPTSASQTVSQTTSSSATPSITPFNYGKDTIRGVNL